MNKLDAYHHIGANVDGTTPNFDVAARQPWIGSANRDH